MGVLIFSPPHDFFGAMFQTRDIVAEIALITMSEICAENGVRNRAIGLHFTSLVCQAVAQLDNTLTGRAVLS